MLRNCLWLSILMIIVFSCGGSQTEKPASDGSTRAEQDKPTVKVMTVERGVFYRELQSNGKLEALQKVDLRFRTAEIITKIAVSNGQRVSAGQEIARIDNFDLRNRVITSEEGVANALMNLNDYLIGQRYELKDTTELARDKPAILQTGYSKSQLLTARVSLEQARRALEQSVLHAPIAGVVANLTAKVGNMASTGEAFCTVIGDERFEVEFPVLESEIDLLKAAREVQIEPLAYRGLKIKGALSSMNPVVDRNGMVKARATVANTAGKLYEGMNVRVLVQQAVPDKLVVPKSAVVMRSDRQVLFVYANGRAQWRYVETGLENSREYTIEKELEPGEQVIISGNFNLAHDAEVSVSD